MRLDACSTNIVALATATRRQQRRAKIRPRMKRTFPYFGAKASPVKVIEYRSLVCVVFDGTEFSAAS
jgi:hypothetical protein